MIRRYRHETTGVVVSCREEKGDQLAGYVRVDEPEVESPPERPPRARRSKS